MKRKKKKTNKSKHIVYLMIGLLVFLIIWIIKPFEKELEETVLVSGKVEYVRCQIGSKGSRSLIKVRYNNKVYNLPITKSKCKKLNEGDNIELIYRKNKDEILIE